MLPSDLVRRDPLTEHRKYFAIIDIALAVHVIKHPLFEVNKYKRRKARKTLSISTEVSSMREHSYNFVRYRIVASSFTTRGCGVSPSIIDCHAYLARKSHRSEAIRELKK